MVHRGVAALALALTTCFLLLSYFDSQFSLIHVYESLIYLLIVLALFYSEGRWAYMLGIVAPAGWLLLMFIAGGFGEIMRRMSRVLHAETPDYAVTFLGGIICVLSVALIAFCAYHWKYRFSGLRKGLSTFMVSLGIVLAYDVVLVLWFWRSVAARLHL